MFTLYGFGERYLTNNVCILPGFPHFNSFEQEPKKIVVRNPLTKTLSNERDNKT